MKKKALVIGNVVLICTIVLIFLLGSNILKEKDNSEKVGAEEEKKTLKNEKFTSPYHDISTEDPRFDTIMWATEKGFVKPDKMGNFNPNQNVTEGQVAQITVQYYETLHKEIGSINKLEKEEKEEKIYEQLVQYQAPLKGYIDRNERKKEIHIKSFAQLLSYLEGKPQLTEKEALDYLKKLDQDVWKDSKKEDVLQKYELIATFRALEHTGIIDLAHEVKGKKVTIEQGLLAFQPSEEIEEESEEESEEEIEETIAEDEFLQEDKLQNNIGKQSNVVKRSQEQAVKKPESQSQSTYKPKNNTETSTPKSNTTKQSNQEVVEEKTTPTEQNVKVEELSEPGTTEPIEEKVEDEIKETNEEINEEIEGYSGDEYGN